MSPEQPKIKHSLSIKTEFKTCFFKQKHLMKYILFFTFLEEEGLRLIAVERSFTINDRKGYE